MESMMQQVDKTRNRFLAQARQREERARAEVDQLMQDQLLDDTVWLRIMASLPSYKGAAH